MGIFISALEIKLQFRPIPNNSKNDFPRTCKRVNNPFPRLSPIVLEKIKM